MTRSRQPGTGRTQIRVGGRWQNKASDRIAIVTQILYPQFVEYKYERPLHYKNRFVEYNTREPYARRTKMSYRRFILGFERPRA